MSTVNLTTAASLLENAASQLGEAASVLTATAGKLKPSNWELSESADGQVKLEAENEDYYIGPGAVAKEFAFLWASPSASGTYKFDLYAYDDDGNQEYVDLEFDSIETDGTMPSLEVLVARQLDVITFENNIVTKDNAKLVIKASEPLSDLGDVIIENEGTFVGPLSMTDLTTTDNIKFEYTFSVGEWDDNSPVDVRVESAKDLVGNENTAGMTSTFNVDTKPPVFTDNGLPALIGDMIGQKTRADGVTFSYVDNVVAQDFQGWVKENYQGELIRGYKNVTVTVEVNGTSYDTKYNMPLDENQFYVEGGITLSEDVNSIVEVTATDTAGNSATDNIENILIDTAAPSISFNSIAGETWGSAQLINDNSPAMEITFSDAGLGVSDGQWDVQLDNDDNYANGPGPFGSLENATPYEWGSSESWTFENTLPELADGMYWVTARVSDNTWHAGVENVDAAKSFEIDATTPTETQMKGQAAGVTYQNPTTMEDINTVTDETEVLLSGTSVEKGSTVKIFKGKDGSEVGSTTLDADEREWEITLSLDEGTYPLYIQETDMAGNTSVKVLLRVQQVDTTAPSVTITEPADGTTTDKSSITFTANVSDEISDAEDLDAWLRSPESCIPEGTVVISSDGTIMVDVPLREGNNRITLNVEDEVGNLATKSVAVKRTVTPWAMYAAIAAIVAIILAAVAVLRRST